MTRPYIRIYFDSVDLHTEFKIYCAKNRITMKDCIMQMIKELLATNDEGINNDIL